MGRTAVNVSGSITAGAVTSKVLGETDLAVFTTDDVPLDTTEDEVDTEAAVAPDVATKTA